ncbi:mediator of RNA polymerase II transcription subunit 26 isoform X2 [Pseudomyrmex gracilis]|nr:mediator of RNA polymerase II transcription subunit 26 isoform X2 [Pseudomyrmex gracilis]XP_020283911.1 mediator of RNA polymerase II transcription subunit 26 isoform X2 [Pseudomyrmex gracilis]
MRVVLEVISALERTTITKELLESTRLGKHINELRRKTRNEALAKRAKDLVRRWRDMVLPSVHSTPQPTVADTAPPALNGAKEMALRNLKPQSPALRGLNPHSPLSLKDPIPLRVLSPALSLHSDHSRSPNASSNSKQSIISTNNHKISSSSRNASPVLSSSSQNHTTEAVPRTHSSNKRLRKEEISKDHYRSLYAVELTTEDGSLVKRQRLNGENISGNLNLQVPSPTLKERISSDRFAENSHEAMDEDTGPKKRGRKKGSKLPKRSSLLEDSVKEKLASISRNPKLKTTQELLADLQSRGSTADCITIGDESTLPSQSVAEPPRMEDVLRGSSSDQVSKYLSCSNQNSQNLHKISSESSGSGKTSRSRENCREPSPESCEDRLRESNRSQTDTGESSTCRSPSRRDLTVEEILAKLPPLDPSSIDWGEDEAAQNYAACPTPPPREVTVEDLERLHTQCVEGLNGNWQPRLVACSDSDDKRSSNARSEEDRVSFGLSSDVVKSVHNNQQTADDMEFREWHQMLARPSYQGDILHIMPYVIID